MAVWKVALSLLKKQKAYGVTIFCLSLVVALMLSAALTVMKRGGELQRSAYENANCPDVLFVYPEPQYDTALPAFLENKEEVENVREDTAHLIDRRNISFNGIEPQEWLYVLPYVPGTTNYKVRSAGDDLPVPDEGEILLPLLYEGYYNLKPGDTVSLNGDKFKIAGFYEDPLFGSPMVGTRRVYIHERDMKKYNWEEEYHPRIFLSVYVRADAGDPDYAAQIKAAADGVSLGDNGFMFTATESKQYSMMVPELVAVVLLSFAFVALLITLYILRYAVLSSIEGNYVTLGIFKAVGFSGGQIRSAVMMQYALVCLAGSVLGVLASIAVIPFIGGILMDAAGLLWNGSLWILAGVLVIFVVVIMICVITWLNTRKIKKISPVRAISFGRAPVYFAKRLNASIKRLSWLPLHLRMALKQMMTRRKQYTVLAVIAALLTFLITFTGGLSSLFTNDRTVLKVFGFPDVDFGIGANNINDDNYDEVLAKFNRVLSEIEEEYQPAVIFEHTYVNITIENTLIRALAYETFDGIGLVDPLSGRFPKYDNELALSPVMSERFGKGVGDTVYLLDVNGDTVPFIVTGIVQCMNEVGQNFSITTDGVRRIAPDFISWWNREVILRDGMDRDAIAKEIQAAYQDDNINIVTIEENGMRQMIGSIRAVIDPATAISYALAVVLIALITFLLAAIALYRENTDIGIFKSTGFTSRQLRSQFALRFLLVSLTGGLLGMALSLLVSDALISFVFTFFGVPKVHMPLNWTELLPPVALVCALALIAAWLVSGKIKRVSGRNLATE